MYTLLQTLLIETLEKDTDPVLRRFIETVLPEMEREFGAIPALGGSEAAHYDRLTRMGDSYAETKSKRWASTADQSLLVHVLNGLLTAWNIIPLLPAHETISEDEKRQLCLGLTLHDYNKYCQGEEEDSPKADEVESILALCGEMGEKLGFDSFWADWRSHLSNIGYLAQNTQGKCGTNLPLANWPNITGKGHRLMSPLRHLLAFGDVAVHMNNPADILTTTRGDRLREHLRQLGIEGSLVYHRLRSTTGLLSNGIHNAMLAYTQQEGWYPLLFFAQGTVYLAPEDGDSPDREQVKEVLWKGIEQRLSNAMLGGDIGFKRDGKGVKVSPQTLELFTAERLIRSLADVIVAKVGNVKNPATPKRLNSLGLTGTELERLLPVADLRCDRLAELISLVQRQFFAQSEAFIVWVLQRLKLQGQITLEQTQAQKGGVNYGWYRVAAEYVLVRSTLDTEQFTEVLENFVQALADWAVERELLPKKDNPTQSAFLEYVDQYLEVSDWACAQTSFAQELESYAAAKTKGSKQPICSLSSGEFASEDQVDSVVLFKPQQYSNKNPLGGGQIKRGISKIWSLEMLLRQATWAVPSGKMEDQKPIFLYLYPAYVYSPQVAQAIRVLLDNLKQRVNFWEIHKFWQKNDCKVTALRDFPWLAEQDTEPEAGRFQDSAYGGKGDKKDLPFMGISYTTTRGKTVTDAWVEPAFLALAMSRLLGIKVVTTPSQTPLYNSDSDFNESIKLDGPASFWSVMGLPESIHLEELWQGRIQQIDDFIQRLLILYSTHLESQADKPDPRWRALPDTTRQLMSDPLNIFSLKEKGCRKQKRDPTRTEAAQYWHYAQLLAKGDNTMTKKLTLIRRLAEEYRQFYRTRSTDSTHAILLPLTKAMDTILSVPPDIPTEDLILEGAGQLRDAIARQKPYLRPILMDKTLKGSAKRAQELRAIEQFMTTCVEDLFLGQYKGDIALLQENRNRLKSGVGFAYQMLDLQEATEQSPEESE
ncbi:MAG: type I-D CRISPR-associated protein Cas10d/Csc3 [Cyanobacteria bacterium J06581_3]